MRGQSSDRQTPSREKALRLARGEITLAQYAGLTRRELYAVAREAYRLMCGGRLEEALTIYRGLAAADPYDSVFRCHLAASLLRTGDAEGSARRVRRGAAAQHRERRRALRPGRERDCGSANSPRPSKT